MGGRLLCRALLAALAASALAFASGCGSDDDKPEANPQTLLGKAAAKKIDSAEIDLRADANTPGFPVLGSHWTMRARGPFAANGPDALPTFNFDVMIRAGGDSFPAYVEGIQGRIYIQFMNQYYKTSAEQVEQLGFDPEPGSPAPASLKEMGLNPDEWLTRVRVTEGEDIDGDPTSLVTGKVDTRAVIEDLLDSFAIGELADSTDNFDDLPEASDENIDKAVDAVDAVKVEVNVDDDGYPRRVYAKIGFTVPKDVEGSVIDKGTVTYDLVLNDIGEAKPKVGKPFDADPLSSLFEFSGTVFGIDEASDLWRAPN